MRKTPQPKDVDTYIAAAPAEVRGKLREMRAAIRKAVPQAEETISSGMPYYAYNGRLAYFAAFKKHIGFYPPVRGNAKLARSIAPNAGAKGNLQFPLQQPIPYDLIERVVKLRVKQNLSKDRASRKA